MMEDFIKEKYETLKQMKRFAAYAFYLKACQAEGEQPGSYRTFCKAIKRRGGYLQTLKMKGHRAANKEREVYQRLDYTTPPHGERPFHIAHIDHTQVDVEMVCSITGRKLGRPWATLMTDAYPRRILAGVMTFDPPSYRSCMMVLREAVRRFGRIPQIVWVDGGLEFSSVYFEALLARHHATKKERTGKPDWGSTIERMLGTTNTQLWHTLQANTQIMKNVRQGTKEVNPKRHAIWTLEEAATQFAKYVYEVYDTTIHSTLGQTPRHVFQTGMNLFGHREHMRIPYDEHFRMMTLPTTAKGTAKVQNEGVKVLYRNFQADVFREQDVRGTSVPVRYDPWDSSIAYAYVKCAFFDGKGRWVKCRSEKEYIFQNRSEREIMLAAAELRQGKRLLGAARQVTAAALAKFLKENEEKEEFLRQRAADRAARAVYGDLIEHPFSNSRPVFQLAPPQEGAGATEEHLAIAAGDAPVPKKVTFRDLGVYD